MKLKTKILKDSTIYAKNTINNVCRRITFLRTLFPLPFTTRLCTPYFLYLFRHGLNPQTKHSSVLEAQCGKWLKDPQSQSEKNARSKFPIQGRLRCL